MSEWNGAIDRRLMGKSGRVVWEQQEQRIRDLQFRIDHLTKLITDHHALNLSPSPMIMCNDCPRRKQILDNFKLE